MTTVSVYELLLALGCSVRNDADRKRGGGTPTQHSSASYAKSSPSNTSAQRRSAATSSATLSSTSSLAPSSVSYRSTAHSPRHSHRTAPSASSSTDAQLLRHAYAVLLQGPPPSASRSSASSGPSGDDLIEQLNLVQFEMALFDAARSAQLGDCLQRIFPDGATTAKGDLSAVVRFLLQLAGSVRTPAAATATQRVLFVDVSQSAQQRNQSRVPPNCYTNVMHNYLHSQPSTKASSTSLLNDAPTSSSSFFDLNRQLRELQSQTPAQSSSSVHSTSNPFEPRMLQLLRRDTHINRIKATSSSSSLSSARIGKPTPVRGSEPRAPPTSARIHLKGHSWDYVNVPLDRYRPERLFASESEHALPHILHRTTHRAADGPLNILTTAALVGDLKSLLAGSASESFRFCDEPLRMCFEAVPGLCVLNGTAETTRAACEPFVECGTCVARLRMMCERTPEYGYKVEGFVFRTVCLCIEDFLDAFGQFIHLHPDPAALALLQRCTPLMRQVGQLAILFAIHPNHANDSSVPLPQGSAFLGHLHQACTGGGLSAATAAAQPLLTYVLRECCRVYYAHLELWLFSGRIADAADELFVECTPAYDLDSPMAHSKHFWDRAFRVRSDAGAVPPFLAGCEAVTLLCGKYTALLRAIRPQHPLLRVPAQRLRVRLGAGGLERVRRDCAAHAARLRRVCGRPLRVGEVFARDAAQRAACVREATERLAERMRRWHEEQAGREADRREERGRQRAVLCEQMQAVQDHKLFERRRALAEDAEVQRQADELEARRQGRERAERERRLEYYAELKQTADLRTTRADAVVGDLREQLADARQLTARMEECLATGAQIPAAPDAQETDDCNRNRVADSSVVATVATADAADTATDSDANANPKTAADGEAAANRAAVLGTTHDFNNHAETAGAQATNLLQTGTVETDVNLNPIGDVDDDGALASHREAARNRRRCMGQEYDLIAFSGDSARPTAAPIDADLTDLQRNRRKVLTEEFGFAHPSPQASPRRLRLNVPANVAASPRPELMSCSSDTPNKQLLDTSSTATASASSGMQTARSTQSAEPESEEGFKYPAPANGAETEHEQNTSMYQSARSLGGQTTTTTEPEADDDADEDVVVKARPPPASPEPFAYPKSVSEATARPSRFFPNPTKISPSGSPSADEGCESDYDADGDDDAPDAAVSITDALRTSYLLPLHTHLSVLSNELLKVLLLDLHALDHLRALRRYFFMQDGEFASHICDGLFARLDAQPPPRPADILNFACLHSLLDAAIDRSHRHGGGSGGTTTTTTTTSHAELLSFCIELPDDGAGELPAAFELGSPHVLGMLQLTYAVEWPLNLLLSPEAIEHYAKVFAHLLALRRCRWALDAAAGRLKEVERRGGRGVGGLHNNGGGRGACVGMRRQPQLRRVQQVRNKLLQFVNAWQNHVTATALQASWRRFRGELEAAESMEDCYQMHVRYLKQVEFLCMLNRQSGKFFEVLERVMVLVLRFESKLKRHEWQLDESGGVYTHANFDRLVAIEEEFDRLVPHLIRMGEKISRCGYQTEISDLVGLINFNGYYDRMAAKSTVKVPYVSVGRGDQEREWE